MLDIYTLEDEKIFEECYKMTYQEQDLLFENYGFSPDAGSSTPRAIREFIEFINHQKNIKLLIKNKIYHVTQKKNLEKILEQGLLPKKGSRSKEFGEIEKAIFFFPTREDCQNALGSWLGNYFHSDIVILEVLLPEDTHVKSDVSYEVACLDVIAPSNIIGYYTEMWEKYLFERSL
jgi:hypothetical protein